MIKFDDNNNLIYTNHEIGLECGLEEWYEYDENNNLIHYKNSDGFEYVWRYDENNNLIYSKTPTSENWYKYSEAGEKISDKQVREKTILEFYKTDNGVPMVYKKSKWFESLENE